MKRSLLIPVFLLALAAGTSAPFVHAQQATNPGQLGATPGTTNGNGQFTPLSTPPSTPGNGNQNPANTIPPTTSDSWFDDLMIHIMELFAWLLGVAMLVLDYAVYYTVVTMGNYINGLSAIGVTWSILRDIGNIVLIFGFLAVGISVIIDYDFYGGGTKMIPKLLIAAVFLNFSLFISEAVIDAGNLFATEFYAQINNGHVINPPEFNLTAIQNEGVSNAIMSRLGLQGIYGEALRGDTTVFASGVAWIVGFMGIILFLIASFVIFSLAFILIARFVALVFIIVIAPVGFAGLAVPKFERVAEQWWGQLFDQALTAPILLLLLYVALKVITDTGFLKGFTQPGSTVEASGWTGFINSHPDLSGFGSLLLSFLVAMGLLLAVTFVSKKLSAFGGSTATKWGSRLTFGLTTGALGLAGRNTVGAGSAGASRWMRKRGWSRNTAGRLATNFLDARAKNTFDVRNASAVKSAAGSKFGKDAGLNLVGTKANYADTRKKAVESREKFAKSLVQNDAEKAAQKQAEQERRDQQIVQKTTLKNYDKAFVEDRQKIQKQIKAGEPRIADLEKMVADPAVPEADKNIFREELASARKEKMRLEDQVANLRVEQDRQLAELNEAHKKELEHFDEKVAATKPAMKYAEHLENTAWVGWLGLGGPGKKEAAEKIKKEAKKSNNQKSRDTLQKILENSSKSEGGSEKKEGGEKKEEGGGGH